MTKKITEKDKIFGKRFKKLRIEKGWRQKDVAEKLGVTRQYICSIERAKKYPSVDIIQEYSKLFNVPIEYLTDVKNHSLQYEHQVIARELGLSDTVINEFKFRQEIGYTLVGVINNIFETGYGWKFLLCLSDFFIADYGARADRNGEFRIVNEDNPLLYHEMIRADKLDKLAELRVIQVLYNIKRKFKGGKYNFEYPSYKDRDAPLIAQLLHEDNDIEERF